MPRGIETLLIVDDEVALLEIATSLLVKLGYTVFTATSGDQALQILHQRPGIDLLFSDIVMPGNINGYELADQAMVEFPDLKILLTSGYTGKVLGDADTQTEYSLTANHILNKPYTHIELATRIRSVLDKITP